MTIELNDDVRLIQRELAKGFVSRDEVNKKHLKLPDVADKGEWIDIAPDEKDDGEGE